MPFACTFLSVLHTLQTGTGSMIVILILWSIVVNCSALILSLAHSTILFIIMKYFYRSNKNVRVGVG